MVIHFVCIIKLNVINTEFETHRIQYVYEIRLIINIKSNFFLGGGLTAFLFIGRTWEK